MILDASVYGVVVLIALLSACKDQCGEAGSATGNPVFLAGVFVNVVPVLLYNARQGSIEYFRGLVPVLFPAIGNSFTLAILFLGLGDTAQPAHGILALIPVATAAYQIFVLCRCDRHGFALKRGAIAANLAAAAILSAVIIAGAIGLDIRPYALTTGIALQIIGAMQ
ncbi:MAG: hypothetical protein MPK62_12200 [Alphaproteobacteria bacterium]|nr:hypothetical protein [Alphaproteobacteria bacterium]